MTVFLSISLITFLITLISTSVSIKASHKTGFLDYPASNPLKIHLLPTPLLGGLGILSGCLSTQLLGVIFLKLFQQEIVGLAIALLILFCIGLLDDVKGLHPFLRLLGHLIASFVVIHISGISMKLISIMPISIVITIFYIIGATNAINLIDGLDGLASGITLIASIGFFAGFMTAENSLGMLISSGLFGTSLGFLVFNFPPAKIFLGDNGSTILGFLLGTLAVLYSTGPFSMAHFLFPLLVLIVPIGDTFLAISRRALKRIPFFYGDRDHVYDQLVRKGLSQRQTMLIICFIGLVGSLVANYLIAH
jgi:UDP-GlcNAc:undecaprenyl-phosphate GlcNAc-1-phosphate transferase